MKAIVVGYHEMGCTGLEALLRHGFEVQEVFTYPDDPREQVPLESVALVAARHGIPASAPEDINHPIWVERIRALAPDLIFSFYYRHLLGKEILGIPRVGSLNLHGSLLPKYRGRAPLNWVLVNGESETGVTLHEMTPRADAGDIVGQRRVPIDAEDTVVSLSGKLVQAAASMLDEELPKILSGRIDRRPQDLAAGSYFGRRRPEDGRLDWSRSAEELRNLVRAVTRPWPGAFTQLGGKRLFVWEARAHEESFPEAVPGTIVSTAPLRVACGEGCLEIVAAQLEGGLYLSGAQLVRSLGLVPRIRLGDVLRAKRERRKKSVLILGVSGFIGNALSERLLAEGGYEVHGMDLNPEGVERFRGEPDFQFHEGDIGIHREWIEYHVKKVDVVIPLVAIATPIQYTKNPLRVFELDFEENLRIVRYCAKYRNRIVFPSTSEVYGMCADTDFDEDRSSLVLGPISKQRWIYSCSKQLLDRVIWAHGQEQGLQFTLFRPFNWIGPRLDSLDSARIGSSRLITQLILNLVEGTPIQLVDGGEQRRSFTDVSDGIECLLRIIENERGVADSQIFNIGSPENEASVRELANMLVRQFDAHPLRSRFPDYAGHRAIESFAYYGEGYQDVDRRRPRITKAKRLLGWEPEVPLEDAIAGTLDYFLNEHVASLDAGAPQDAERRSESGAAGR